MKRRFVSIFLPFFDTDSVGSGDIPTITMRENAGRCVVVAANRQARQIGIRTGHGLTEARARCPDISVLPDDPEGQARRLEKLARRCWRWTPWVMLEPAAPETSPDGSAGIALDITGCSHLFGGEDHLCQQIKQYFSEGKRSYLIRIAVAGSRTAALALSRFGPASADVPDLTDRIRLAGLPVAGLCLPPLMAQRLKRVGLRSIADLYPIPRAALMRRFGPLLRQRLDAVFGVGEEPFDPLPYPCRFAAARSFPEPVSNLSLLEHVARDMLQDLCAQLEHRHLGARRLAITGQTMKGQEWRIMAGTARPCRDAGLWLRLLRERWGAIVPEEGIESFTILALQTERLRPRQHHWRHAGPPEADHTDEIWPLISRLQARLGRDAVKLPRLQALHWPERAGVWIPARDDHPLEWDRLEIHDGAQPPQRERPLTLLPAPIMVAINHDDDGRLHQMRWQGRCYDLRDCRGPEKILPIWWEGGAISHPRDYFQVQEVTGKRFWIFQSQDTWFLHGVYA